MSTSAGAVAVSCAFSSVSSLSDIATTSWSRRKRREETKKVRPTGMRDWSRKRPDDPSRRDGHRRDTIHRDKRGCVSGMEAV